METVLPPKASNKKKKYLIFGLVSLVVIAIGVIAGIMLLGRRQLVEQEAAVPGGIAQVTITPATQSLEVGESFAARVLFDTGGTAISALTIQLEYSFTGDTPPITTTDGNIQINSKLPVDELWDFPVKSVREEGGKVIIRIAGFSNSIAGYTTTGQEVLATINFEGEAPGSVTVSFNATESKITKKSDGADTLLIPQSTGRYTVTGGTTAPTNTPSPESVGTPAPTTTPIATASATATPAPIPETGVSLPVILGVGIGLILIVGSALIAI